MPNTSLHNDFLALMKIDNIPALCGVYTADQNNLTNKNQDWYIIKRCYAGNKVLDREKFLGVGGVLVVREGSFEEVPLKVKSRMRRCRLDRTQGKNTADGGRVNEGH